MSLKAVAARHSGINLIGKNAVVFGGTSGIGEGLAGRLARANVAVTIVGRNIERGEKVLAKLRSYSSDAQVSKRHSFIQCDAKLISNLVSVTKNKDNSNDSSSPQPATSSAFPDAVHFLVLTQSNMTLNNRTETSEGLDEKLSLNYYSRVACIYLLASRLALAKEENFSPRIISVLAAGKHKEYSQWENDPELKNNYSLTNAANAACMYNDLAVDSLSKEFPNFSFTHAYPGFVDTNWGSDLPWYVRGPVRFSQLFARSIDDCAEYLCCVLFDDEFAPTKSASGFLCNEYGQLITTRHYEPTDKMRETVWAHTKATLSKLGVTI